jgi:hypothetical protein
MSTSPSTRGARRTLDWSSRRPPSCSAEFGAARFPVPRNRRRRLSRPSAWSGNGICGPPPARSRSASASVR